MRRPAWLLLLAFVFAVPWEYSLDLGEPLGNVARLTGLALLLVAIPAVLARGRLRAPGPILWITLALYLWFCLTSLWSIDEATTLIKLRAFFQEMMLVALIWEFAETPEDLRNLFRAAVAGGWILALLTLAEFRSAASLAEQQIRFAAYGQDPNDVARFLDLCLPLAALTGRVDPLRPARWLALAYLPVALAAIVLTASRGGVLAALLATAGAAALLLRGHRRLQIALYFTLPALAAAAWIAIPSATLTRLSTIPSELRSGSLNQRMEIWRMGWRAFARAPFLGHGMGNFTLAAGLNPGDTAHNTPLALAVSGGVIALFLASLLVVLALRAIWSLPPSPRLALLTAFTVWLVTSATATVEENRFSWLLIALAALAGRLRREAPQTLDLAFSDFSCRPADAAPEPLVS